MTEDEKREYRKAYYLKNKERLLQKSKEYKEKHKEEGVRAFKISKSNL